LREELYNLKNIPSVSHSIKREQQRPGSGIETLSLAFSFRSEKLPGLLKIVR
jgi:hypothetical protein